MFCHTFMYEGEEEGGGEAAEAEQLRGESQLALTKYLLQEKPLILFNPRCASYILFFFVFAKKQGIKNPLANLQKSTSFSPRYLSTYM